MNKQQTMNSFRRFLILIKPERKSFILLALCSLLGSGLMTAIPFVMGIGIDNLLRLIQGKSGLIVNSSTVQQVLVIPVLVIVILTVTSSLFSYIQERIMAKLSETITLRLRKEVTKKIKVLPMSFFDQHQVGDILSRTTNDINRLAEVLLTGVNQLFSAVVNIVFGVSMLLYIDSKLTAIVLILLIGAVFVTGWIANKNKHLADKNQSALGELNNQIEEFLSGNLEIKTFNLQEETAGKIQVANQKQSQAFQKAQFMDYAIYPAMRFLNQLAFIISAIVGAGLVIQGAMTIGIIQAYLQYINQISEPITTFSYVINAIQGAMASFEHVLEILDAPEEVEEVRDAQKILQPKGQISFENIRFGYSPDKLLMEDVSFTADAQNMVAIVGPTGAGKTTLVNLLMRFYETNGGRITFDDVAITDLSRRDLRKMFGMVLQNTWLFEGTVAENIAYGRRTASRKEIIEAAKIAQCDHFIRTLPQGYDTIISSEAGSLSQGQQQLLTIARVILANPPVVILDEATSSVDTRTEAEIQKAMRLVTQNRTSFVIAHRLSTIVKANLILVMEAGTIVEQGNHHELLEQGGLYAKLYKSQFKD